MSDPPRSSRGFGRIQTLRPKLTAAFDLEENKNNNNKTTMKHHHKPRKEWRTDLSRDSPSPPTPDGMESIESFESSSNLLEDGKHRLSSYEPHTLTQFGSHPYPSSLPSSSSSSTSSSSSASSSRLNTAGYRPSEIVASARSQLHKAIPTSRSTMNIQFSAPIPRRPSAMQMPIPMPPSFTSSSSSSGFTPIPPRPPLHSSSRTPSPVLSQAVSDQAMDALADAQIRASGIRNGFMRPNTSSKFRPYEPIPTPSQPPPQFARPPIFVPTPIYAGSNSHVSPNLTGRALPGTSAPIQPPPPPAASFAHGTSLSNILRQVTPDQQQSLFLAGGMYTIDRLCQIESSNPNGWHDLTEVCQELTHMRNEEEGSSIDTAASSSHIVIDSQLSDSIRTILIDSNSPLLSPLPTSDELSVGIRSLIRSSRRGSPAILEHLKAQGCHFTSLTQLAQATGSFALRVILKMLILQPIVLPELFRSNHHDAVRTSSNDEIGWKVALEWFEYGPRAYVDDDDHDADRMTSTSSSSSAPLLSGSDIVTILESFVTSQRHFRSIQTLNAAMMVEATRMKENNNIQDRPQIEALHSRTNLHKTSSTSQFESSSSSKNLEKLELLFELFSTGRFLKRTVDMSDINDLVRDIFGPNGYDVAYTYLSGLKNLFEEAPSSSSAPWFEHLRSLTNTLRELYRLEEIIRTYMTSLDGAGGDVGGASLLGGLLETKRLMKSNDYAKLNVVCLEELLQRVKEIQKARNDVTEKQLHTGSILNHGTTKTTTRGTTKPSTSSQPSHPLLPILTSLVSGGCTFPSVSSFHVRVSTSYLDHVTHERSILSDLSTTLATLRGGSILTESCLWSNQQVRRLLELCNGSIEVFARRIQQLIQQQKTRQPWSTIDLMIHHFEDLNNIALHDRQQLYHHLHSPLYPLWSQRVGGAAVYTGVTLSTIDELFKHVGPSTKDVKKFLETLIQTRTKLKSVEMLLQLAREQSEITSKLFEKRKKVRHTLRIRLCEYFEKHWSLFEQCQFKDHEEEHKYMYDLTSEQRKVRQHEFAKRVIDEECSKHHHRRRLNHFLYHAGVNIATTNLPRPEDAQSIEYLQLAIDHLIYTRRTYDTIGKFTSDDATPADDEDLGDEEDDDDDDDDMPGRHDHPEFDVRQSELVRDIRHVRTLLKGEKRSTFDLITSQVITSSSSSSPSKRAFEQSPSSPSSSSSTSHGLIGLLSSSLVSSLTLDDMDRLMVESGVGVGLSRVIKELMAKKNIQSENKIERQRNQNRYKDENDNDDDDDADDAIGVDQEDEIQVCNTLSEFATLIRQQYVNSFLPLRRAMHQRLLEVLGGSSSSNSSSSVLLPSNFRPTIEGIDMLIDSCVLERILEVSQQRLGRHVVTAREDRKFVRNATSTSSSTSSPSTTMTSNGVSDPPSIFTLILSSLFHTLLVHLQLLEECQELTCESLYELRDEILGFRREQIEQLKDYLQANQHEIFDAICLKDHDVDTNSHHPPHPLRWDSFHTSSIFECLLSSFHHQTFLFQYFYDRILIQQRTRRAEQFHHKEKMRKMTYHATHQPIENITTSITSFDLEQEKRPSSFEQFLETIERLRHRHRQLLRRIVSAVNESGLLPTPSSTADDDDVDTDVTVPESRSNRFFESHALAILGNIDFVREERQLQIVRMLLNTLAQSEADKERELRKQNQVHTDDARPPPPPSPPVSPFSHPSSLIRAVGDLVHLDLNHLSRFLTSSEGPCSTIFTISFQNHLAEGRVESCQQIWIETDGSRMLCEKYVRQYIQAYGNGNGNVGTKVKKMKCFDQLDEFLNMLRTSHMKEIEYENEWLRLLYAHRILIDPSHFQLPHRDLPNRITLQRMLKLSSELGHIEKIHTLEFLKTIVSSSEVRHGRSFETIHALNDHLNDLVDSKLQETQLHDESLKRQQRDFEDLRRTKEEQRLKQEEAYRLEEEENKRQRIRQARLREEMRERVRTYLLSADPIIIASNGVALKADIVQPSFDADEHATGERQHILDALLHATHNDPDICLRSLASLQSQSLTFETRHEFLEAIESITKVFDENCSILATWFHQDGKNEKQRILPRYISIGVTEESDARALMLEFDSDAQLGVAQVQALVMQAVERVERHTNTRTSTSHDPHPDPAFTSFAALHTAMRVERERELASLHRWLETPSAEQLFIVAHDQELSATECELQRLLLAAPTWQRVHRCIRIFQAQSRQFDSMRAIAAAVTEQEELQQLRREEVIMFVESSGLLSSPLTSVEESLLVDRLVTCIGDSPRVLNELISIQQERLLANSSAIGGTFDQLIATLDARDRDAVDEIRTAMAPGTGPLSSYYTGSTRPTDDDLSALLSACIDVSLLSPALSSLRVAFTEWDLLILEVSRFAYSAWMIHTNLQQTIRGHDFLTSQPIVRLVSYFDTTYLLSLVSTPSDMVDLLAKGQFVRSGPFETIEEFMNAIAQEIDNKQ